MDYKSLRFIGYDISEEGRFESAMRHAMAEIESRNKGHAPDEKFKEDAAKFRDAHKAFGEGLIKRAENGEPIERIELVTLARAEQLYATTVVGPRQSKLHENLADGFNLHGKQNGLSMTEKVARLTGMESPVEKPVHRASGASHSFTVRSL